MVLPMLDIDRQIADLKGNLVGQPLAGAPAHANGSQSRVAQIQRNMIEPFEVDPHRPNLGDLSRLRAHWSQRPDVWNRARVDAIGVAVAAAEFQVANLD